jgi:hypothetical protein
VDEMTTPEQPAYAMAPWVLHREIDGQMVLLNMESEQYFGLDDVGAEIVSRLISEPVGPAMTALERDYGVDAQMLARDVAALIDSLVAAGLLVEVDRS